MRANIASFSKESGYNFSGAYNIQGNAPDSHLDARLRAFRNSRGARDNA